MKKFIIFAAILAFGTASMAQSTKPAPAHTTTVAPVKKMPITVKPAKVSVIKSQTSKKDSVKKSK